MQSKKVFQSLVIGISLLALCCAGAVACVSDDDDDNDDGNSAGGDADTDTDTDADTDADSDTDTDTDSDTEADADTNEDTAVEDPCAGYPSAIGEYQFITGAVVPPISFPAMNGPKGATAEFDMCEIYRNRETIKSVVFVVGAEDCIYCPGTFIGWASIISEVVRNKGDIVGIYYVSMINGNPPSLGQINDHMNDYGWDTGWRVQDPEKLIWGSMEGAKPWIEFYPFAFLLQTSTMKIVGAESLDGSTNFNILNAMEEIQAGTFSSDE